MLLNLSTFVRSSLTTGPTGTIALSEEIELQRLYLAIEEVRFGDRLKVEIDFPDALGGARLPALILQPLVENAIRHGVGRAEGTLTIRIAAAERDGMMEIRVEDDGTPAPAPAGAKPGVGLANVRARLNAHFGAKAGLEAGPLPGRGFRATLRLPRRIA
jgi:LytS/YehU family sensor histidine kinase